MPIHFTALGRKGAVRGWGRRDVGMVQALPAVGAGGEQVLRKLVHVSSESVPGVCYSQPSVASAKHLLDMHQRGVLPLSPVPPVTRIAALSRAAWGWECSLSSGPAHAFSKSIPFWHVGLSFMWPKRLYGAWGAALLLAEGLLGHLLPWWSLDPCVLHHQTCP